MILNDNVKDIYPSSYLHRSLYRRANPGAGEDCFVPMPARFLVPCRCNIDLSLSLSLSHTHALSLSLSLCSNAPFLSRVSSSSSSSRSSEEKALLKSPLPLSQKCNAMQYAIITPRTSRFCDLTEPWAPLFWFCTERICCKMTTMLKLPGRPFPSLSPFRQERPNATRPSESVVTLAPSRVL